MTDEPYIPSGRELDQGLPAPSRSNSVPDSHAKGRPRRQSGSKVNDFELTVDASVGSRRSRAAARMHARMQFRTAPEPPPHLAVPLRQPHRAPPELSDPDLELDIDLDEPVPVEPTADPTHTRPDTAPEETPPAEASTPHEPEKSAELASTNSVQLAPTANPSHDASGGRSRRLWRAVTDLAGRALGARVAEEPSTTMRAAETAPHHHDLTPDRMTAAHGPTDNRTPRPARSRRASGPRAVLSRTTPDGVVAPLAEAPPPPTPPAQISLTQLKPPAPLAPAPLQFLEPQVLPASPPTRAVPKPTPEPVPVAPFDARAWLEKAVPPELVAAWVTASCADGRALSPAGRACLTGISATGAVGAAVRWYKAVAANTAAADETRALVVAAQLPTEVRNAVAAVSIAGGLAPFRSALAARARLSSALRDLKRKARDYPSLNTLVTAIEAEDLVRAESAMRSIGYVGAAWHGARTEITAAMSAQQAAGKAEAVTDAAVPAAWLEDDESLALAGFLAPVFRERDRRRILATLEVRVRTRADALAPDERRAVQAWLSELSQIRF